MAIVEMVMPKMGESVMEGTVLNWLKKVGDRIEQDESVLEVATDKVDTEVPAVQSGVLKEILAKEGEVVQVGHAIALIEVEGAASVASPVVTQTATTAVQASTPVVNTSPTADQTSTVSDDRFYSPLVRSMAKAENISQQELASIPGTGKEGRVTKDDMQAYLQNRSAPKQVQTVVETNVEPARIEKPQESLTQVKPAASYGANVEIVELDRMRKMIAQRMVDSKRISPHVTSFIEADVTNVVNWRNKWKRILKDRDGINLTFTPIFLEAIVKALQDFPKINASVDGDRLIIKKDINIGMATALPDGNLIVPVIKNANFMNLLGITNQVNSLAKKARENKLSPDDLSGGTYTVSNIGNFGNMLGTPIIMQPQIAIMSLGAIIKKPAVITTEDGDLIGIRHMMYLSHSYDHRVVDGALGGSFVRRVADYLENFDVSRTI